MKYKENGTMVGKPFDEELYKRTDKVASDKFIEIVKHWYAVRRQEDYGIDTEVYYDKEDYEKGEKPLFTVELEINLSKEWEKGNVSFSSILVFERKTKNISSQYIPFHLQFNKDLTDCAILSYSEVLRNKVYEGNFKTGRDRYYLIPATQVVFGLDNIEQYAFEHVCKMIKRHDLIEKGYKDLSKAETKGLFALANHIHKEMFVKSKEERSTPIPVLNKENVKHKFYWQIVEDRVSGFNDYLVYYDKESFINGEDALFRIITDQDEYIGWDKGELPHKSLIIRRAKRLYFQTHYIPFHIHYNYDMKDSCTIPLSTIVQSIEYDKDMKTTELGYIKTFAVHSHMGIETIEQFIFEYACKVLGFHKLIKQGMNNTEKKDIVRVFSLVNNIYNVVYGLDKLK